MHSKHKRYFAALLSMALLLASLAMPALAEGTGVQVAASSDSATGYRATFTYENEEALQVKIMGGFNFYRPDDIYALSNGRLNLDGGIVDPEHLFGPETWEPGLARFGDSGYVADMLKGEDNLWEISVDLPSGSYLYQYVVTRADGEEEVLTDPGNIPWVNALGASQARSQFYVPFDQEKQAEADDWTFVTPLEDESQRGEVVWLQYEGLKYEGAESNLQQMMVYLPAGYDAGREEPYKTLYLCHGGGGEEGDWFYQGNAHNIADRLIASGEAEPFVIVAPDISQGADAELIENILNCAIPYMEENYHVSQEVAGRAFAGLSKGGKLTYAAYQTASDQFAYFGVFSVGHPSSDYSILDAVALNESVLYLAAGYADNTLDYAFQKGQVPMAPFSVYLSKSGVEYVGLHIVEGGHDWFTWPQTFRDFVQTTLWK